MNFPFKIIECDSVPQGAIYLIPKVDTVRVFNETTGGYTEFSEWNPKEGATITNIGCPDSGQGK